ncbi:MAG: nicotinate-nicotinamide nucleotide adenylyltransferase [Acetobacter sp.]|nr:nicotinate-nicotinamide nucleotide adenylyltransferase [Acetobacter sp.]
MNNILLIPGSFNPITNAHIEMAKTAQKAVNANKVYFIPAHDTYVAKKKTLIPGLSRCRLIEEATPADMTYIPNEIESFLPKKTYDTVQELRDSFDKAYKFYNFYICLGVDNIKTLTSWYNWQPFVEENMFVACSRAGEGLETALKEANLEKYKDHFIKIQIPRNNTSSSLVRNLCEQGKFDEVKELVPENVYEYLRRFYDVLNRI